MSIYEETVGDVIQYSLQWSKSPEGHDWWCGLAYSNPARPTLWHNLYRNDKIMDADELWKASKGAFGVKMTWALYRLKQIKKSKDKHPCAGSWETPEGASQALRLAAEATKSVFANSTS